MTQNRYAAKRDKNEKEIVQMLIAHGADVQKLNEPGCPDLLVNFRQTLYLLEVKEAKGKLTPKQVEWHAIWHGTIHIVHTPDEALEAIGTLH